MRNRGREVSEQSGGQFYSYENRQGVLPISWEDFTGLCKGLALAIAPFQPDVILGVARGGLYPATFLSHVLRAEMYPIRITRRFQDEVVYEQPTWLVRPPDCVAGAKVLIVDEICDSGGTLTKIQDEVSRLRAAETRTAVMYSHLSGRTIPDYIGIISDALIINPWDREIVSGGKFAPHPEYLHAFRQQGIDSPLSTFSVPQARTIAKKMT
ncbi:MAG: hypothetical protein NVSMB52_12500 [Chloroflexota bacterium]